MPTITPPTCRLQTARLISDRDLQLLRRFDKKDPAYQAKLLEEVRRGVFLECRRSQCWHGGPCSRPAAAVEACLHWLP